MSTYPTTNLMDINHIHVPTEECIVHNFKVNFLQQAIVQDTNWLCYHNYKPKSYHNKKHSYYIS